MIGIFLGSASGLIAGNFIYQAFCAHPDWMIAAERSIFQLAAVGTIGAGLVIRDLTQ